MMAVGERQTQKQRRKMPSFSSSLLDAIYHSIDEPTDQQQQLQDFVLHKRNNASQVEEEIENLRRAIKIEKWMQNHTTSRHFSSNSASSTDSSCMFSSSETDSASRSSVQKLKHARVQLETTPKSQGRFTRTKSRAMKIYGDLKKVKEPISPGGKIASFLNSIFSPRNLKKNQGLEEWNSIRKSRSMKDTITTTTTTTTCLLSSRSCLSKNPSSSKSKRSVRFCPVSVTVNEDSHKSIYDYDDYDFSMPNVGSRFIKKNIDSFRVFESKNARKHEFRDFYEHESDDKSCGSSDLFELENIGVGVGVGVYEEELPVYGTTSLKMNQAIASGLII